MATSWFKSPRTPASDMNQVTHVRMADETPPAPVGARRAGCECSQPVPVGARRAAADGRTGCEYSHDGGTDASVAHAAFAVLSWPTTVVAAAATDTAATDTAAAAAAPTRATPTTTTVTARAVWRAGQPLGPIPLVADSSASTAPDETPSDAASTLGTTLGSNLGVHLGVHLDPSAADTFESTPTPQLTPRREWGGTDTLARQAVLVAIRTVAAGAASATMGSVSSAASSTTSDASWDLGVGGTLIGTAADKGVPSAAAAAAAAPPTLAPAPAVAAVAVGSDEAGEAAGSFGPGVRAASFGKSAWTSPHARMQSSPQRRLHASSGQPLLGEMDEGVVLPVR